jgi:hypothetical protein
VNVRIYPTPATGLFSVALEDDNSLSAADPIVRSSGYTTWVAAAIQGLYFADNRDWIVLNRQSLEARIRKEGRS